MTAAESAVRIEPALFGPPGRQLFGLHYVPAQPAASGVLMCPPFGHEAVRSHRFHRVLADRLAAQGHAVLRFDYHGSGESPGDGSDADLDRWAADVRVAHEALRRRTPVARVSWFGLRLGAVLALRAAAPAPAGLAQLLLWDAIGDGVRYQAELRTRHRFVLEQAFGVPQPLQASDTDGSEALGYPLPPALRAQLDRIDLAAAAARAPCPIVAFGDPAQPDGQALERAVAGRGSFQALEHDVDWTSDSADNKALVPPQALLLIARSFGSAA